MNKVNKNACLYDEQMAFSMKKTYEFLKEWYPILFYFFSGIAAWYVVLHFIFKYW